MANQIQMAEEQAVIHLHHMGWSNRRIAKELGIHRETVGNCVRREVGGAESKPAIPTAGNCEGEAPKPAIPTAGGGGRISACEPWRGVIEAALEQGLSAQRIYQDLVTEGGFDHDYESVKRFVRKLRKAAPQRFFRLECAPGEEAQVDYGQGAWIEYPGGKRKRSHVLRVVLSYSRKGYSEAGYRQTTESFIRGLENSFRYFGGVPKTLVIDNLKAAVQQADWYDPILNPKIEAFCRHYGTMILPTRPRTPRHKGKVERGIDYVQENALRGRSFAGLKEQNEHLWQWERTVADQRIHGTTRQQVAQRFETVERATLLPLPMGLFPCFQEGQRTVHRDSYIEVQHAYYEVPEEYIGRTVWVRWDAGTVRISNQRGEQIAVHARMEPGRFSVPASGGSHSRVQHMQDYLLKEVRFIGPECAQWAEAMAQTRGPMGVRVLMGFLALTRKYPGGVLERACRQARQYGAYRLHDVRRLLEQPGAQDLFEFMDTHPLIRPLNLYEDLCRAAACNHQEEAIHE